MIQSSGTQVIVSGTDAAIGTSGKPTRIFAINILSDGTAGVVQLRNGTSASATLVVTEHGVISQGKTIPYGTTGFFFPAGCFLDVSANVVGGAVSFSQEAS